jgi:hypothetical protein
MNPELPILKPHPAAVRTGLRVEIRQPAPEAFSSLTGEGQPASRSAPDEGGGAGGTAVSNSPGGAAVLDFISSNETLDRYDEIICASGWKLDSYLKNPVFQNAHQYGDVIFTLGKALITEVRGGPAPEQRSAFLFQRIEFAVEANPMARIAYALYRGGFLNAVSVGFIPLRWEEGGAEAGFRRRYLEQELLEVSAVGIPANPEALQLGFEAGAVLKTDLLDLLELLSPAAPRTPAGASGVRRNEAQLLQLARALREILRRN